LLPSLSLVLCLGQNPQSRGTTKGESAQNNFKKYLTSIIKIEE